MVEESATRMLHHEAEDGQPSDGGRHIAQEDQLRDVFNMGDHLSENKYLKCYLRIFNLRYCSS